MRSLKLIFVALFFIPLLAKGQSRESIVQALDTPVDQFVVSSPRPVNEVLELISRTYGVPVIMDANVKGDVQFRVYGTRLRGVLDAICRPQGWSYEVDGEKDAYIAVHRFVTRIYSVDYLQLSQTSNSSASVSLAGQSSGSGSNGSNTGSSSGQNGQNGSGGGSGESSVSLSSTSQVDFWTRFEADTRQFIGADERLIINRFAGLVQLTANLRTHSEIQAYIEQVMKRVRRSARITVRLVRVDLNNTSKQGVDWSVAAFSIGAAAQNTPQVGGTFNPLPGSGLSPVSGFGSNTTNITDVGGTTIPGETFRSVISSGKVTALITALKEQGDVTVANRSTVSALNNQMALIQVSEDRPLFTRESETTFNQGSTGGGGVTPTTEVNFTVQNVSFGNVLEVTPQIDDNLVITLAVAPSLTDFRGTVTSPDGNSTAFNVGVRRYRSTVVLRSGETAVIGGFIEDTDGNTTRGIPGLSSLPLVGKAFRTDARVSKRSELAILITVDAEDPLIPSPKQIPVPAPDQNLSPEVLRSLERRTASPIPEPAKLPAPVVPVEATKAPELPSKKVQIIES